MDKGHLFVISGPSGAGKGTILKMAMRKLTDLAFSVSCTTRDPRPEDEEGVTYFFVTKENFREMIEKGEFLEWAEVHGNYYGTKKAVVMSELEKGRDILLEIDVQGALQVKKIFPEAITLFIAPPSFEVLKERLTGRATEDDKDVLLRLKNAETELSYKDKYDKVVINDDLGRAVNEFIEIVKDFRRK